MSAEGRMHVWLRISVKASTAYSPIATGWLGDPLDVGWAIDVLHPRALQPVAIGE